MLSIVRSDVSGDEVDLALDSISGLSEVRHLAGSLSCVFGDVVQSTLLSVPDSRCIIFIKFK